MSAPVKHLSTYLMGLLIISGCSKSGGGNGAGISLVITSVSLPRALTASTFSFVVRLDKATSQEVKVDYSTQAGSALANTDFKPVTGTLTIPAGQQQANIDVEVTGDSTRKEDQLFFVQLSNPQNASLTTSKATGTIVNANGLYYPVDNAGYSTPATYPGYTLSWSDEFNGNQINASWWNFEVGKTGWGNNELENYTSSTQNAFVSAGNLIIEARREPSGSDNYTSARMISKNNKIFKFGRIDIRAKVPKGQGIWPALWMLGNNIDAVGWPACGEIDILELLGHEPNKIYGTLHYGVDVAGHRAYGSNYILGTGSFDQQFHVYSIVWVQDSIKILVDDHPYVQFAKSDAGSNPYPFNADFFFIFNIAVGGNWPGSPNSTTPFPQRLVVDYVRVFQ